MLRKLLRELMEGNDRDITNSEVANACGTSDATISHFFTYKNELTVTMWMLSVRFLAPEKEKYVMDILADEMIATENRLNCRLLMEYASTKRDFVLLDKLVTSQKKAPKENKDWAIAYDISMQYQRSAVGNEEILDLIDDYRPKTLEMKIFAMLLRANALYMLKEYKQVLRLAQKAEILTLAIKNDYIKESFTTRIYELYARGYLFLQNNKEKSRFYANYVINSRFFCAEFTSHLYHILGTSFVFESYSQSLQYFRKYQDTLRVQGRNDLVNSIEETDIFFLKVLWSQSVKETETSDILEKMHFHARLGNREIVEELYQNVEKDNPFALCYLGTVNNDPDTLLQSLARFIETGNKFYVQLARKELLKFPIYHVPATVICDINIA